MVAALVAAVTRGPPVGVRIVDVREIRGTPLPRA
jgi:hypothetical protein